MRIYTKRSVARTLLPRAFRTSSTLCCVIRTVSAEVTHPLQARQSDRDILAVAGLSPVAPLARIRFGLEGAAAGLHHQCMTFKSHFIRHSHVVARKSLAISIFARPAISLWSAACVAGAVLDIKRGLMHDWDG